ncbi:hypothetical protein B0T26DRAFT_211978 [Lasiosphaeria miniovina]|uniref:Uncharacterized protein n=1 Tax=Lasiosphaeria miniovina TaxID=1954250 RepID=A0AA40AUK5_9PEZI|nr:uncharacterized protein B0T26DRAFT_211978 [Lasiosphaeria miniovina]KAK0722297.1 hypothetical protein B0T26DRAFT_211978 [Lasiosphaeria miniovina]
MPPVNHVALTSAGIIVVSVAVAAAIAVYESPEVRRMADDLRRRIAIALHSLGDNVDPNRQDPMFNRPEDAEGFLQSGAESGVDADEETRRRQREELMYWNAQREEMKEKVRRERPSPSHRGSTFDDFLTEDKTAPERGTLVFNTGADIRGPEDGLVRRRGIEGLQGLRGLNASVIANPFSDEHGIDFDDHPGMELDEQELMLAPGREEIMSDIYEATPRDPRSPVSRTVSPQSKPVVPEVLFDFDSDSQPRTQSATVEQDQFTTPPRSVTLDRELADDEFMTAGQDDRQEAYSSIQAWAQGSHPGFYSPLPVSPQAPLSEAEYVSHGDLTPTDSVSLAGSGEDIGNYAASSKGGDYDVLSDDEDGIATPNSWSEVGSVVSSNDDDGAVHA